LQITFANAVGRFDVDVTTFQMAVLFAWNQRPFDRISYENLRLATELPDPELRRTLWVCRDSLFFTFTYINRLLEDLVLSELQGLLVTAIFPSPTGFHRAGYCGINTFCIK